MRGGQPWESERRVPSTAAPAQVEEFLRDQEKYKPQLIIQNEWDRVNQAMAQGANPIPALMSFSADVIHLCRDDWQLYEELCGINREMMRLAERTGFVDVHTLAAAYKGIFVAAMQRNGLIMIDALPEARTHKTQPASARTQRESALAAARRSTEGQDATGPGPPAPPES